MFSNISVQHHLTDCVWFKQHENQLEAAVSLPADSTGKELLLWTYSNKLGSTRHLKTKGKQDTHRLHGRIKISTRVLYHKNGGGGPGS